MSGKENNTAPNTNKNRQQNDKLPLLKIYFPSQQTVNTSYYPEGAGLLHLKNNLYNENLQDVMYPWIPLDKNRKILPHSKVICSANKSVVNWIYVGSHNLSQESIFYVFYLFELNSKAYNRLLGEN